MDLRKLNRDQDSEHWGKLHDDDVEERFGGRFGARFRALTAMIQAVKSWTIARCNAFRFEKPRWQGMMIAGSLRTLLFDLIIVEGNRCQDGAFICNRDGLYHISALFAAELVLGDINHPRLALMVNGQWYSWLDITTGITDHWILQGSDLVPLNCGDVLTVGFFFDIGGANGTINWGTQINQSYGYFGGHWECDLCASGAVEEAATATEDTLDNNFGDGAFG